jgi:hypothetical protein
MSITINHLSWQDIGDHGDNSWAQPPSMGSAEAMFVEDNSFEYPGGSFYNWTTDHDRGARAVWRRNNFTDLVWADHGTETGGRERSVRQTEIYQNTFQIDDASAYAYFPSVIGSRGGTGMVFDNVVNLANGAYVKTVFDMATFRSSDEGQDRGWYLFGPCGARSIAAIDPDGDHALVTVADPPSKVHDSGSYITISGADQPEYNGTFYATAVNPSQFTIPVQASGAATGTITYRSPFDQNTDDTGYRCIDQIGAGQGALLSGDFPQPAPANQALEPRYVWNNSRDGELVAASVNGAWQVVQENRDFYNQAASFTGDAGIGRGAIAERPSTCTPGVAFWATDEGEWDQSNGSAPDGRLYRCGDDGAWAVYYTPFTYPHPLTACN